MFEGKTADCLALANTAILIRLIEQLVERGAIARPNAHHIAARRGKRSTRLPGRKSDR